MYAIHYRILFPRTISEKEYNTITIRYIEVITKAGLVNSRTWLLDGTSIDSPQLKPLTTCILVDHMHVLAPCLSRDMHIEWYKRMLLAIDLMAELLDCDKA